MADACIRQMSFECICLVLFMTDNIYFIYKLCVLYFEDLVRVCDYVKDIESSTIIVEELTQ